MGESRGSEKPQHESAIELARLAARRLAAARWEVEAEPELEPPPFDEAGDEIEPPLEVPVQPSIEPTDSPSAQPVAEPSETVDSESAEPIAEIVELEPTDDSTEEPVEKPPPSAEQILEAMLFSGEAELTAEQGCAAIRGLTPETFRELISQIASRYRRQRRPYSVRGSDKGFWLAVRPEYRELREKLFGGPKEARLSASALDVLSLVAYKQPIGKAEVDAVRGADSGGPLRQLVRLGLIAMSKGTTNADGSQAQGYVTTSRFLELFGLASLEELPRLGI